MASSNTSGSSSGTPTSPPIRVILRSSLAPRPRARRTTAGRASAHPDCRPACRAAARQAMAAGLAYRGGRARRRGEPTKEVTLMTAVPNVTLNNGVSIPQLGFGVFQIEPDRTRDAVLLALETGYRHIDTAEMYGNEKEVGQGVRDSGVPRAE